MAPDYLFIDTMMLAYRLGRVRHEEQKNALMAAARAATDAITFLQALENFGVGRRTELYRFVGQILSAPAYYRAEYPGVLGLMPKGQQPEAFLGSLRALALVEGVLTSKQQQVFRETFWHFVRNHDASYLDPKKGMIIGAYATEPKDNAATVARFGDYLSRLRDHSSQSVRKRFEGFPVDIVVAILERAFP